MEWEEMAKLIKEKRQKLNYRDNSENIQCCLNCSYFIWGHDEDYTCELLNVGRSEFSVDALAVCDKWEREKE